jgi:hypothetical protein
MIVQKAGYLCEAAGIIRILANIRSIAKEQGAGSLGSARRIGTDQRNRQGVGSMDRF